MNIKAKKISLETILFTLIILGTFFMPLAERIANRVLMLAALSGCFLLYKHGFTFNSIKRDNLLKVITVFLAVIFFTTLFSTNIPASLQGYLKLLRMILPLLMFVGLKEIKDSLTIQPVPVFVSFLLGTTCASLYAIYQYMSTGNLYVTAFYHHHVIFGSFMELSLPIALALLLTAKNNKDRLLYVCSGLICLVALILTQARGPWIASATGLIVVAVLLRKVLLDNKKMVLIGTLILLTVIALLAPLYASRVATLADTNWPSNYIRVMIWQSSLQMIQDFPLFGVGLDQFSPIYNSTYLNPLSPERYHRHAHNTFLTFATECGLIGLTAFLALICSLFCTLIQTMKQSANNPYTVICLAILSALVVNSMVDRTFLEPSIAKIFWLFVGLTIYEISQ